MSSSSSADPKVEDVEKAGHEQRSVDSAPLGEVDLANYYEDKAGSLVVDPAYVP
jgi:hypothetical protein